MFLRIFYILILVAWFCLPSSLEASEYEELNLPEEVSTHSLSTYAYFLEDPSGELRFTDVEKLPFDSFTKNPKKSLGFGFTRSTFWVRFQVTSETSHSDLALKLDYPLVDNLDIYEVRSDGTVHQQRLTGPGRTSRHR